MDNTAISFLEFYDMPYKDQYEYLTTFLPFDSFMELVRGWDLIQRKNNFLDFYRNKVGQSFIAGLIPELFEDWYVASHNNLDYYHNSNTGFSIRDEELYLMYSSPERTRRWLFPKNVDRFICHCQDIGVILKWKVL